MQELIQSGIDEGARLLCGGTGLPPGLNHGYFARPTIFSEVTPEMRIAQEEIFGPVLVIQPYEDEEDAIRIANATVYGLLQPCPVGRPGRRAARGPPDPRGAGAYQLSGMVGLRAVRRLQPSGNGREYGVFALEEYLEVKAILGY